MEGTNKPQLAIVSCRRADDIPSPPPEMIRGYCCRMCKAPIVVSVYSVGVIMHKGGIALCNGCTVRAREIIGRPTDEVRIMPLAAEQMAKRGLTIEDIIGKPRKP